MMRDDAITTARGGAMRVKTLHDGLQRIKSSVPQEVENCEKWLKNNITEKHCYGKQVINNLLFIIIKH